MKEFERQISDIAGCLRRAKDRDAKCSVLVGAGCSKSAGIPLASEMINIIKKECADAYRLAERHATNKVPTYSECMNQLSTAEVHHLIATYVDNAKLNWAHLGLAQLVEAGFVDRVLTTNFDPLVVRACNLVGVSPSVYDFAASADFQEDMVDGPAVYYLHGQRTGFRLLNVSDDLEKHTATLDPIINDSCRNRVWIVVGYSGENDAVFQCLSKISNFRHNLYWVIRDDEPKAHLHPLFQPRRGAYYVKLPDADGFFCELANELGCFPPRFITEPFAHFLEMIKPVMDFTPPGSRTPTESILQYPRDLLQAAIENQNQNDSLTSPTTTSEVAPDTSTDETKPEAKVDSRVSEVLLAFLKSDYDRVLKLTDSAVTGNDSQLLDMRSDALIALGNQLYDQGTSIPDVEAMGYFVKAAEKYQQALNIKSDKHGALLNWGNALDEQARRKDGAAADELWAQAIEKYQQTLTIKPDKHDALYNWGVVLGAQARRKDGAAADELWAQAIEKYQQTLAIKPDDHEALNNWGIALAEQARRKDGAAADELWAQAIEKYQQALNIKPDKHEALNNWGYALLEQATRKVGDDRENLLILANEKCQRAEELQAGAGAYNLACIAALRGRKAEARFWLEKCVEFDKLPPRQHMEEDTDLDSLRELSWFEEILQKAPQS